MSLAVDLHLQNYAKSHCLEGLTLPSIQSIMQGADGYTTEQAKKFLKFQERINNELLQHRIIRNNAYTTWFKQGQQNKEQIKAFIVQFSVFSNQFLIAQLSKTLNAESIESMRASKEILANELGVVFRPKKINNEIPAANDSVDPELVSTEGSIEGGLFHFRAAHFEWLLRISDKLGLTFNDMGKRCNGTPSTLFFCDELIRLYGGENYAIAQTSSYAVENWAAAGFWGELVSGFEKYNAVSGTKLPLAFFTWHDRIESQHALHTQEELEEIYFTHDIDEDNFIKYGNEILDGVAVFWDGLEQQRKQLQ